VLGPGDSTAYPATDVWDCRPWINGSSEECVVDSPADGVWRIMLRAYIDFTNVTVQASFTSTGNAPDQYHFADTDIAGKGTVSGSFAAHEFNDGDMQIIREATSGGNPSRRTSLLDHQWRIPGVTSGTDVTLHLVAAVSDSGEGDTISFTVSYNGGDSWQALCLSDSSCDLVSGGALQYYPVTLPATTSGTVLVRARDNDRSPQHLSTDVLYVDQMYIATTDADTEPPAPPPVEPPASLVLEASGEKRRKGQIFVLLQWSPETAVSVEWSVDGVTFNEIAPLISGSGYEHNTGLKGSPTLYYRVCTAPGECSNTAMVAF
jgi:hypothetical protein